MAPWAPVDPNITGAATTSPPGNRPNQPAGFPIIRIAIGYALEEYEKNPNK